MLVCKTADNRVPEGSASAVRPAELIGVLLTGLKHTLLMLHTNSWITFRRKKFKTASNHEIKLTA